MCAAVFPIGHHDDGPTTASSTCLLDAQVKSVIEGRVSPGVRVGVESSIQTALVRREVADPNHRRIEAPHCYLVGRAKETDEGLRGGPLEPKICRAQAAAVVDVSPNGEGVCGSPDRAHGKVPLNSVLPDQEVAAGETLNRIPSRIDDADDRFDGGARGCIDLRDGRDGLVRWRGTHVDGHILK